MFKSNGQIKTCGSRKIFWRIFVLVLGLMSMPTMAKDDNKKTGPAAQFTAAGEKRCLRCHAAERMTVMAKTVHGNPKNPHTPYAKHGCESCHGPGSLHVSRARGGRGFPALIRFGEEGSAKRQTEACISCHAKDMGKLEGMQWIGSVHAAENMTCVNCHQSHIVGNPLRQQKKELEVCTRCHKKQIINHNRFEKAGIVFDNLACFDCHDVHQLIGKP